MKAEDFEAVTYQGDVYCVECLPPGVDVNDPEVHPIFSIDEVDDVQICCDCGCEHDYMSIIGDEGSIINDIEQEHNLPSEDENLPIQEDDSND
jgi:hypothetical protein